MLKNKRLVIRVLIGIFAIGGVRALSHLYAKSQTKEVTAADIKNALEKNKKAPSQPLAPVTAVVTPQKSVPVVAEPPKAVSPPAAPTQTQMTPPPPQASPPQEETTEHKSSSRIYVSFFQGKKLALKLDLFYDTEPDLVAEFIRNYRCKFPNLTLSTNSSGYSDIIFSSGESKSEYKISSDNRAPASADSPRLLAGTLFSQVSENTEFTKKDIKITYVIAVEENPEFVKTVDLLKESCSAL